jgi:hypothetical protein
MERRETSIRRIALEGIILEWPLRTFYETFTRKLVLQLDEISLIVGRTKTPTRTRVFAVESVIKFSGREWGQRGVWHFRRWALCQFIRKVEAFRLQTPTVKIMELHTADLV